jgi:hypothetical protein
MRAAWGWGLYVTIRIMSPSPHYYFLFALTLNPDQSHKRVTRIRGLIVSHIYFVYDLNTVGTQ